MSPVALGLALVLLLVPAEDEEGGGGGDATELTSGALRIGEGAVPAQYAGIIEKAAADCDAGLPAAVLAAQLMQESGFNPRAGSPAGAQGIAQFIPATWAVEGFDANGDGKASVWDPEDAIPSQGRMMCKLVKTAKKHSDYNGSSIELALAGYNAGWGRVDQYRGVPPKSFAGGETYNYVKIIMGNVAKLSAPDGPTSTSGWTLPVKATLGTPYHQAGPMWSSGYHTGIDFAVPVGTPIKAAGPGTVLSAGPGGPYGNQVIIKHGDGMYSQYAHLSSLKVSKGQKLKGGDLIGLSGATGNVSGPHLHMEVRTGPAYGSDVDPVAYLRRHGVGI
ncbi:peptidoglycan DD-metalloendopeptidase family protein [Streptomyces sp. SAJ15]|uniref:peptidoglycan DD-metalloendopeptidase family protein n=1 Tax=Streptomyces sp. SAJ15 TaxID=2011095 RepID=UPI001186A6E0|nr:peptidase M23 [Streptomyces sp. SAJ15]